jgi:hypothetical protein
MMLINSLVGGESQIYRQTRGRGRLSPFLVCPGFAILNRQLFFSPQSLKIDAVVYEHGCHSSDGSFCTAIMKRFTM